MILQTKLLIASGIVTVGSGYAALKQHDQRIVWEALAKQQADTLKARDKVIVTLIHGVAMLDSTAAKNRQRYVAGAKKLADSLATLDKHIDELAATVPDSSPDKPVVKAIVAACQQKVVAVQFRLSECDRLRSEDSIRIAKRDETISAVVKSRDGWKKLFDNKPSHIGQPTWLVVLEVTAALISGLSVGLNIH